VLVVLLAGLAAPAAHAAVPPQVSGLVIDRDSVLAWDPAADATDYNVYRAAASAYLAGGGLRCHGDEVLATSFPSPGNPGRGDAYWYLVTAESDADGEGTPGNGSGGADRALLGACDGVMRQHVLDRLGYGWNEWTRDRVGELGLAGYIDEQLDPASIGEADNTVLHDRRDALTPPPRIHELIGLAVVNGIYARRQLEQTTAIFWADHFNTDWQEIVSHFVGRYPPALDPDFPKIAQEVASDTQYRELERFRDLAFNGTFREIVETSAKSPAMIIYLDTDNNVVGAPNENYARELLELYALGVDGGYTQRDVEELARVLTGWNVCKKLTANADDPLAPCLVIYWVADGQWVANFRPDQHDCGEKVLFAGTPHEAMIPATCDDPPQGLADLELALDAIVAHPATAEFISTKLLQHFLAEDPSDEQIAPVVDRWELTGGNLREVLREILTSDDFLDPERRRSKLKTPLEHLVGAFRATRGMTDGIAGVLGYLARMQHLPFYNPVPTGYSELGGDWLDTNGMLERQNLGMNLANSADPDAGSDIPGLLSDYGLDTAEEIVGFFADALYGGALTDAERQEAIDYLNTDDAGQPDPYDPAIHEARAREAVGFLLGYPHFLEQ
jgi:uncharacterized protein (DUF1800 family)